MRYTTTRRYDPQYRNFISATTIMADCGHTVSYYGPPEIAEAMLRENGGAMTSIGTVCRECHQRQQAIVQENIRQIREAHR
jgi:hypothetical protein